MPIPTSGNPAIDVAAVIAAASIMIDKILNWTVRWKKENEAREKMIIHMPQPGAEGYQPRCINSPIVTSLVSTQTLMREAQTRHELILGKLADNQVAQTELLRKLDNGLERMEENQALIAKATDAHARCLERIAGTA